MIKAVGITKAYNKHLHNQIIALNAINLEIKCGEMVSIMGRSGAGKSTLLHVIACIERFDAGKLFINNIDVSGLGDQAVSKIRNIEIGIVLQNFSLIESETALYNVMLPLFFSDKPFRSFKKRALDILHKLDIKELSNRKINEMSGGQKQRVAIARALINNPDILLADEPTGSLDSKTSEEIMGLMKELNRNGKTIVVVTHDNKISEYCHRNIIIEDGKILDYSCT